MAADMTGYVPMHHFPSGPLWLYQTFSLRLYQLNGVWRRQYTKVWADNHDEPETPVTPTWNEHKGACLRTGGAFKDGAGLDLSGRGAA